jgi:hypothetical protein
MSAERPQFAVHPHGPIEELEENLWRVEGTLPRMALRRVMTLIRTEDGRVIVHNAVCLEEAQMERIERWGCPALLLVPSAHHRTDVAAFKARYPTLSVYCPRGALRKVTEVAAVDGDFDGLPSLERVSASHLDGTADREGVVQVRHDAGVSLVLNDAVFNMPHVAGVVGLLLRHVTGSTGGPRVSRIARWLLVDDRQRFADQLRRLADTPELKRVIVSHHLTIDRDPATVLRQVAESV